MSAGPMLIPLAKDAADAANDSAKFAIMIAGGHVLRQYVLGQPQSIRASAETIAGAALGFFIYNTIVRKQVLFVGSEVANAMKQDEDANESYF